MSLIDKLARRIFATGPITVADFMTACLHDPQFGYYATRPAIGADGDFLTAPMVSQMFGELIGLWAVETWVRLDRPGRFRLVEIGPGDGTLMGDLLRAASRVSPEFCEALDLWLIETSQPLIAKQRQRLSDQKPQWGATLSAVPQSAPMVILANEVLDCLPARQFCMTHKGWAERMVGVDDQGGLTFGLSAVPAALIGEALRSASEGMVVEQSAAQEAFACAIAERIVSQGGAALLIDYGRDQPDYGDTLQALWRHQKTDPLKSAGLADLTVHADFPAVAAAAASRGADVSPITTQGVFLTALGIHDRVQALCQSRPDLAPTLQRQVRRLVGEEEMGVLFKVIAIGARGVVLPGF